MIGHARRVLGDAAPTAAFEPLAAHRGRAGHPGPRRLPPRPGAPIGRPLVRARLRGRAGPADGRAAGAGVPAAGRGRHAALLRLRRGGRRTPRRLGGRLPGGVPRRLPRDAGDLRRPARRSRARCSTPTSWTRRSTRSPTNGPTGPTGSRSPRRRLPASPAPRPPTAERLTATDRCVRDAGPARYARSSVRCVVLAGVSRAGLGG